MIVACVRTGTRYSVDYVHRLKAMVARHLPVEHEFVCLTDRPEDLEGTGIRTVLVITDDIMPGQLRGWWNKMVLFREDWRHGEPSVYFDLDTVVCGDLAPLASLQVQFGICANFTRAAGNLTWPCRYGSCVMVLGRDFGNAVWRDFVNEHPKIMARAGHHGDQKAIEELIPAATILQDVLPPGFFLGYRDLTHVKPPGCSVVVFAGRSKPHNCTEKWIRNEWTR